jgi:hypothetical protein
LQHQILVTAACALTKIPIGRHAMHVVVTVVKMSGIVTSEVSDLMSDETIG